MRAIGVFSTSRRIKEPKPTEEDPVEPEIWDGGRDNRFSTSEWHALHAWKPSRQLPAICYLDPVPKPYLPLFQLAISALNSFFPSSTQPSAFQEQTALAPTLAGNSNVTVAPALTGFAPELNCLTYDEEVAEGAPPLNTSVPPRVTAPRGDSAKYVDRALRSLIGFIRVGGGPITRTNIDGMFSGLVEEWSASPSSHHEHAENGSTADIGDERNLTMRSETDENDEMLLSFTEQRRHFLWLTRFITDALHWKHEAHARNQYPASNTVEFTSTARAQIDAQATLESFRDIVPSAPASNNDSKAGTEETIVAEERAETAPAHALYQCEDALLARGLSSLSCHEAPARVLSAAVHYFINGYIAEHRIRLSSDVTTDWFVNDFLGTQLRAAQNIQLPDMETIVSAWNAALNNLTSVCENVRNDASRYQPETKSAIQARRIAPFRPVKGTDPRADFNNKGHRLYVEENEGLDREYFAQFPRIRQEYIPALARCEADLSQTQTTISALDRVRVFRRIALHLKISMGGLLQRDWVPALDFSFDMLGIRSGEWLISCIVNNRVHLFAAHGEDSLRCLTENHAAAIPTDQISLVHAYLAALRDHGNNAPHGLKFAAKTGLMVSRYDFAVASDGIQEQTTETLTDYIEAQWLLALLADLKAQKEAGYTTNTNEVWLNLLPFRAVYARTQADLDYEIPASTIVLQSLNLALFCMPFMRLGANTAVMLRGAVRTAFRRASALQLSRSASYRLISASARPWLSKSTVEQVFLETYRTTGARVSVSQVLDYTAERIPRPFPVEPVLSESTDEVGDLPPALRGKPQIVSRRESWVINRLTARVASIPEVKRCTSDPLEQCEKAVEFIETYHLANQVDFNLETRLAVMWNSPTDNMPVNHFVSVFSHEGRKYIVDPTAAQFTPWWDREIKVLTERHWLHSFSKRYENYRVAFRDFKQSSSAGRVSERLMWLQYREAIALLDDPVILNSPTWASPASR